MSVIQNGIEATREMRNIGYNKMIIGLTQHCLEDDVANFRAAGASLVLSKPLKYEQVTRLLAYIEKNGTTYAQIRLEVF